MGARIRWAVALVPAALLLAGCAVSNATGSPMGTSGMTGSPAESPVPLAAFLGDSYTSGVGASSGNLRWSSLVSRELGAYEGNYALGGTGYLAGTEVTPSLRCEESACPTLPDRVATLAPQPAAVVFVAGGINDLALFPGKEEAFTRAVNATLDGICTTYPKAGAIVVLTPFGRVAEPTTEALQEDEIVAAASDERSFITISGVDQWFVGHPELLTADGGHPNDAGHARIAQNVLAALQKDGTLQRALDAGTCSG
jgi:lysophospholipase L1-like esterase